MISDQLLRKKSQQDSEIHKTDMTSAAVVRSPASER